MTEAKDEIKSLINTLSEGQLNKLIRRRFSTQYKKDILLEHFIIDDEYEDYHRGELNTIKELLK